MFEPYSAPDLETMAAATSGGTPDGAPHHHIHRAVSGGEAGVQFGQSGRTVRGFQRLGEADLKLGIWTGRLPAMYGPNNSTWSSVIGHRACLRALRGRAIPPSSD